MVDHSNRLIAFFNGAPGSTKNTVDYALKKGIEVITNNSNYTPKKHERKEEKPPKIDYPENINIGQRIIQHTVSCIRITRSLGEKTNEAIGGNQK